VPFFFFVQTILDLLSLSPPPLEDVLEDNLKGLLDTDLSFEGV